MANAKESAEEKRANEAAQVAARVVDERMKRAAGPSEPPPEIDPDAPKHDETIPGGRYTTADGRLVNAAGVEIKLDGTVKKPRGEE